MLTTGTIDWAQGVHKTSLLAVCTCGRDRQPRRKIERGLSLLICQRCELPTTERKEI